MKPIKNFVDNIHNEVYKDSYSSPLIQAEDWVLPGERQEESLDGAWNFSVDQYDNCLRAKWFLEQDVNEEGRKVPLDYGFDDWEEMEVPSVLNLAEPELFYYEGPAVYCRRFSYCNQGEDHVFLRFGAVAYEARVFLNGVFLGLHKGGSTPFCVEVTKKLKPENRLIVVADNTRKKEAVPSDNTDWFSYGGIYRGVSLVRLPAVYIKDMHVWLSDRDKKEIAVEVVLGGWQQKNESKEDESQTNESQPDESQIDASAMAVLEIRELGIRTEFGCISGRGCVVCSAGTLKLWSPESPKLYDITVKYQGDVVKDRVGFRTVETSKTQILLNGLPLFLRGVCLHEDSEAHGKAVTREEIREALQQAKRMNCNFLRLAHYPHTEWIVKMADEEGLLLWEEIPVYWWIDFGNEVTLRDAKNQLSELIIRDWNRASVILWSVGNENPDTDERYHFMAELAAAAKCLDTTRLITAACLVDTVNLKIADRLEQHLDVIGLNEYYGWYDPDYEKMIRILDSSAPEKPVLISEFGADGAALIYEDDMVRGSETEQAKIYREQIAMFGKSDYIQGTVPWILYDYRTPKRLGKYQKGYNIKGLITADRKHEKLAFGVMKEFYMEKLLEQKLEITEEECREAMEFAVMQVKGNLAEFTHSFKKAYSENGFYHPTANVNWTTGFWTGQIWLAYEWCGNEHIKEAGEIQVESFLDRIEKKIEVDHHDMGFLYTPSCVAAYKLTGNIHARQAAIKAADQLISRFQPIGGFIQAWGPMNQPENYRFIIDCLLNLPLLYWAAEETGHEVYREIAEKHIHTAIANVIREDFSTWHTFFMNMETGEPDHGSTCQGYRDGSAWARGQAWGIYGTALAYRYTKEERYLEDFKHVTGYFLNHLPEDLVPYWDLEFSTGSEEPRDSSSASIAACGMLEMAEYLPECDAAYYKSAAKKLMKAVVDYDAVKDTAMSSGLVLHGTYSKKSPYNTCTPEGVDECNIWGDYFYMEALTRLTTVWSPYW